MIKSDKKGYSMVEVLVVIAIIGLLLSFVVGALGNARAKARDVKRKAELAQIGRLLGASDCFLPTAGAGDYDFKDVANDFATQNPQYAEYAKFLPKDPKSGSDTVSNYRYLVTADRHCAIYANLENEAEIVTLPALNAPTPASGDGVLRAAADGPNGTPIYYQISK